MRLYAENSLNQQELDARLKELEAEPEPGTIQELISLRADEGTHSIIDIERVAAAPGFGVASPLSAQEYRELLGTAKPTHEMVQQQADQLEMLRERGEGVYVLVYKEDQPDEIFFTGFSGD